MTVSQQTCHPCNIPTEAGINQGTEKSVRYECFRTRYRDSDQIQQGLLSGRTPAVALTAGTAGGAAAWAQGPAPHGSQRLLLTLALQIATNNRETTVREMCWEGKKRQLLLVLCGGSCTKITHTASSPVCSKTETHKAENHTFETQF